MSRTKTPEETRQEYTTLMGADLGRVFYALYNQLVWLNIRWHQYTILFGTKPERVNLVNAAAGLFFRLVQDSLWEDTLLHLSRMTDRTGTGGKLNLTIRRLPELTPERTLREELRSLVDDAVEKTTFARDWRNRKIAHSDLGLAIGEGAKTLSPAGLNQVRVALDAMALVLNHLEAHYKNGTISFESRRHQGDAEALLYVIRDGLEVEEALRKRAVEGHLLEEDLRPTRPV